MLIAFGLESIGILALYQFGSDPILFVVLTGLVFFAWGEIYSLFPRRVRIRSAPNTRRRTQACSTPPRARLRFLVPLSSLLTAATGNWHAVFIIASLMNAVAALMAWFVLRPMRRTQIASARIDEAAAPGGLVHSRSS